MIVMSRMQGKKPTSMNRTILVCEAFLLALSLSVGPTPATAGTPVVQSGDRLPSLAPMLKSVLPAVVSVSVKGRAPVEPNLLLSDPFFHRFYGNSDQSPQDQQDFEAVGSGVVVDAENGYIITNNHVVEEADDITVTLGDGRSLQAGKIGTDPDTDVAVIQVHVRDLTALPFGDSDALEVGDFVVAIGNPFGLLQTVTSGIVSALGRRGLGIEGYESFIQTDASINPGNSGGALVNLRGELVGINSAIVGPTGGNVGIGFAIPGNMVKRIMLQLIAHGEVRRGEIGISIQDLTADLAKALGADVGEGVVVAYVQPRSPAAEAKLKAGDIITALNGEPVKDPADLKNKVGLLQVGATVQLDIVRENKQQKIVATTRDVQVKSLEVSSEIPALTGTTLQTIPSEAPEYGGLKGAVVAEVKKGTRAADAGLLPDDIIVSVNRKPVESAVDVERLARQAKGPLLLQIVRDNGGIFLVIETDLAR
jgi:serine protease Do/serine protease DegQ